MHAAVALAGILVAAGLDGGRLDPSGQSFKLRSYRAVPGLAVSGTLRLKDVRGGPILGVLDGTIRVSGARAAHGTLAVKGTKLSGTLARQRVSS